MEQILARSLIRFFVRKKLRETMADNAGSGALNPQLLDNIEFRMPQLESGIFKPEDTYLLAECLQKRLEFHSLTQPNAASKRLQALRTRLETIKQNTLSSLDAATRNQLQLEAERINHLPDLAIAIKAPEQYSGLLAENTRKARLRKRGTVLMISALFACGILFGIFATINETVAEDISNMVALATLCLPSILLLTGLFFVTRGNAGKEELEAQIDAWNYLESKRSLLERLYGTDKSRYNQIYRDSLHLLDALLARTRNQDLRSLFPAK